MAPSLPSRTNGVATPTQTTSHLSPRIILGGNAARILCVADIRGDYHELNRLIREHEATAVIHTGDFGFLNADSLERMGDKILRHLLQYSPLIPPATRNQLLSIPPQAGRSVLLNQLNSSSIHFPLSQFPHLLSGAITFPVPVFTVWGLIEDVRIVEKFRTGEYEVSNLTVIDEASSALIETAGLKLRLFGLGGAVALHKMFDNGEGYATIAGSQGTMWTTALQMGELVDTAQRTYDPAETRVLVTSAPVTRTGLLSLIALGLKADLTISGGLHFRYAASLNDFAVYGDFESYRQKLVAARDSFVGVYDVVKDRVESILSDQQNALLKKVLATVQKIPASDDNSWTNTWHWVLTDALCGHVLLAVTDGRVSAETRSNGLNFAHRANQSSQAPSAPLQSNVPAIAQAPRQPVDESNKQAGPAKSSIAPSAPVGLQKQAPVKPSAQPARPAQPPVKPSTQQQVRPPRAPAVSATSQAPSTTGKSETKSEPAKTDKPASRDGQKSSSRATPVPAADASSKEGKDAKESKDTKKADKASPNGEKEGEASETGKPGFQTPKRFSLYIKGLPQPTSEAELRSVFGDDAAKITSIKLLYDTNPNRDRDAPRRQKNFAYVDFANETDLQETLKAHPSGTIRDTTISVELSNPPIRNQFAERGRGSGRGRGRGGRGGGPSRENTKGDVKSETPKPDTPKNE